MGCWAVSSPPTAIAKASEAIPSSVTNERLNTALPANHGEAVAAGGATVAAVYGRPPRAAPPPL